MDYQDLNDGFLSGFVDYNGHETVRRIHNPQSGLISYVSIHNTNLGPALGGCRVRSYETEDEAIHDVLRLSKGMTYKNALAGLPLGGGKSVVIADPYTEKTNEMMIDLAVGLNDLNGRYISAEDSGLSEEDVRMMAQHTEYVAGFAVEGSDLGGNPSPVTAYGIFCAMRSAVKKRYGQDTLDGLSVSVQGLGAVGYELARLMHDDGASLFVCDMREETLQKARSEMERLEIVGLDQIFDCDADIFAPCAMGAQLNENTIPRLTVDLVAGAANNQLATDKDEKLLEDKNILYAPDYVVNSGGVIAVAYEYFERIGKNPFDHALTKDNMIAHVEKAAQNIELIFEYAEKSGLSTGQAANQMAEKIFLSQDKDRSSQGFQTNDQQDVYKTASR